MKVLQGKGVSKGVAIGRMRLFARQGLVEQATPVEDTRAELARFVKARAKAAAQLEELSTQLAERMGRKNALLFEIHQIMLEDAEYTEGVEEIIQAERASAEYAVSETARRLSRRFAEMDDAYMRERAADVLDVSLRVLAILAGRQPPALPNGEKVILFSDDFMPSETATFDREHVIALVTSCGAANSHTAIFARTMGIPAITGLGGALADEYDGRIAVVDGTTGELIVGPDRAALATARQKIKAQLAQAYRLERLKDVRTETRDGRKIGLYANIGGIEDARHALKNGADGIGLYRTVLLYMQSAQYPTEEEQFAAYRDVVQTMEGRRVVIRTLDIGADKQAAYFGLPQEANPALGCRGIRVCLERPDMFLAQLRAIYRASAYGKASILLPMVTAVWEVRRAKELAAEAREGLAAEGIAFDKDVEVGVMIETPAAVMIGDMLAKEADFFSVGTNDLTQYTLAADRQNHRLGGVWDPHHPAVLRMVKMAADSIHARGKWIGMCGELAADEEMTGLLLAMGIDELSVVPGALLPLREKILGMGAEDIGPRLLEALE